MTSNNQSKTLRLQFINAIAQKFQVMSCVWWRRIFAQYGRVTVHATKPASAEQPLNLFVTVKTVCGLTPSLSSLSTNWWLRLRPLTRIVVDRPRRRNDDSLIPWWSSQIICDRGLWWNQYHWNNGYSLLSLIKRRYQVQVFAEKAISLLLSITPKSNFWQYK